MEISGNAFTNNGIGVSINNVENIDVLNNNFDSCGVAISFEESSDVLIRVILSSILQMMESSLKIIIMLKLVKIILLIMVLMVMKREVMLFTWLVLVKT